MFQGTRLRRAWGIIHMWLPPSHPPGLHTRTERRCKRSEVSPSHETRFRCTYVAPEATRDGVG
jgi:hypothetical protein